MAEEYGFIIQGKNGHFLLNIVSPLVYTDETRKNEGDGIRAFVETKTTNFTGYGDIVIRAYEIYDFHTRLEQFYKTLQGKIQFYNDGADFLIDLIFDDSGHVSIIGWLQFNRGEQNKLEFELISDQTFLGQTLSSLQHMVEILKQQFEDKRRH